jgi:hypothetical protein
MAWRNLLLRQFIIEAVVPGDGFGVLQTLCHPAYLTLSG